MTAAVSMPVSRPMGRALLVASASTRPPLNHLLGRLGFECSEADDPYAAAAELLNQTHSLNAVVLSLASIYREELALISTLKSHLPALEIWLVHTEGHQAALAEAVRLGADGLIDEQGLHRMAPPPGPVLARERPLTPTYQPLLHGGGPLRALSPAPTHDFSDDAAVVGVGEPVLSAEELRALLADQPVMPPSASALSRGRQG